MKKFFLILLTGFIFSQISYGQNDRFNYEFALIEAARQKTIGNINESIKLYQKCIEVNPDSDVAYYELGSIYIALNQANIAEQLLAKAFNLEPDNYWYILAYSQILDYQKEYKKLSKILRSYLKDNDKARIRFSLANTYYKMGKSKRALKILESIEKEKGVSEQVLLKKVEIFKEAGKYEKGEKEIRKLLEVFPEAPDYNIIMAEFLEETGSMIRAVEYYHKAYVLDSANLYAISNLADFYTAGGNMEEGLYFLDRAFHLDEINVEKKLSTLVYFLGQKDIVNSHTNDFIRIVNTLLEKYPGNYDIKTVAFDFFNEIEDYDRAYSLIRDLAEENKDNYSLWQRAIYTASLLNKYDDIIEMGDRALAIFPNKRELKLFMGIAYYQKEDYQKCYNYLSESYEPGFDSQMEVQFLTFLAESAYKIQKVEESFYYFEELLLLQPDNFPVMNNYSYYMALEETTLERAEELSLATIIKYPDNPTYLDTYAWVLFKMQRFADARKYIQKAMEKEIEDPDIYYHYAMILCQEGDRDKSTLFFQKAIKAGFSDKNKIENAMQKCEE